MEFKTKEKHKLAVCPKCSRTRSGDGPQWLFQKSCVCPPVSLDALIYDTEIDAAVTEEVVPQTVEDDIATLSDELGDDYEVSAQIGKGGMATVYKVFDKRLEKTFAFKVFRDDGNSEAMKRRFEKEAKAVSDLTHANIGAVFGHGETKKGRRYIALDWIDGKSLSELIEYTGKLPVDRALDVFIQLCEALQHAHMKNVVHRDLKPSNVMVRTDDSGADIVKVIDFGVASILQVTDTNSASLTQTGDVFGTPLYMSPEQCRGEQVDRRSDIYSLGCVMYEALTGSPPFPGKNAVKVVLSHLKERPAQLPAHVPEELSKVIMQCLEKSQEDRFQTVDEVLQDLIAARDGRKPAYLRFGRPGRLRRLAASVVDGLILGIPYILITSGCLCAILRNPAVNRSFSSESLAAYAISQVILFLLLCLWGPGFATLMVCAITSAVAFALCRDLHILTQWLDPVLFFCSFTIVPIAMLALYHCLFESSRFMATPGQSLLGLAVADSQMKRLTLTHAVKRYLFKWCYMCITMLSADMQMAQNISKSQLSELLRWFRVNLQALSGAAWEDWLGTYVIDRRLLSLPVQPKRRQVTSLVEMSLSQLSRAVQAMKAAVIAFGILMVIATVFLFLPIVASGQIPVIAFFSMIFLAAICATFVPSLAFYLRAKRIINERLKARRQHQLQQNVFDGSVVSE